MSKAKEPQFGVVEIEAFAEMCPNLDRHHLPECARQALAPHGASPRKLSVGVGAVGSEMSVRFGQPDPTVTSSYQRGEFVEKGAICLAALLTPVALDGLRLVRVSDRGSCVDYFLADSNGREVAVLEVGGTDNREVDAVCKEKLEQASASHWRRKPFFLSAYAVAVRFADVAAVRFEKCQPGKT